MAINPRDVFNPETNFDPTQADNFTGRSQGITADRSGEILAEGLGQIAKGAALTVDNKVQKDIRTDVENLVDTTNKEFGYDVGDAVASSGVAAAASQGKAIPPELKKDAENLGKIRVARSQGVMSESLYWARLASAAKTLRARYPGYNEQIDEIISSVTGARPANALRSALQQDEQNITQAANDSEKRKDAFLYTNSEYVGMIAPGFFQNPENYDKDKLIAQISKVQAQDQLNKANITQLELDDKAGKADQDSYVRVIAPTVASAVSKSFAQITDIAGFGVGKNFNEILGQLSTIKPTTEQIQGLQVALNQAQGKLRETLNDMRVNGPAAKLSPDNWEKVQKEAWAQFEQVNAQIAKGEYSLAGSLAKWSTIQQDSDKKWAMQNIDGTRELATLNAFSPQAAADWYNANNLAGEYGATFLPAILPTIATGNQSIDETIRRMNQPDAGGTQAEKSSLLRSTIKALPQILNDPTVTGQQVNEVVKQNYANNGMSYIWEQVKPENRIDLYTSLTNPAIAAAIAAKGDSGAKDNYLRWMAQKFITIPEVRGIAGTLNASQDSMVTLDFDPQSMQFSVRPSAEATQMAPDGTVIPSTRDPLQMKMQLDAIQERIIPFNRAIANIAASYKAFGIDPSTVLPQLLSNAGITEGPDGGQNKVNRDRQSSLAGESAVQLAADTGLPRATLSRIKVAPEEIKTSLRAGAEELGVDPVDLATAISYETGGTFNPGIKGGKGGNYQGIIQFGANERAQFGVTGEESFAEQVPKMVAFLKARGLKPGSGLLDIYSTINAGSPGLYDRSDRPGYTVSRHVEEMLASRHRSTAMALLDNDD